MNNKTNYEYLLSDLSSLKGVGTKTKNLLNLLNVDDENLYNFKLGKKININIDNNRIAKLFKNYIFVK